jgi:hypothetical protein
VGAGATDMGGVAIAADIMAAMAGGAIAADITTAMAGGAIVMATAMAVGNW